MGLTASSRRDTNKAVLEHLKTGDIVKFKTSCFGYHWGVKGLADGKIVHLVEFYPAGYSKIGRLLDLLSDKNLKIQLKANTFEYLAQGTVVATIDNKDDVFGPPDRHALVHRLQSLNVGVIARHNKLTESGEHFTTWVRHGRFLKGRHTARQVATMEVDSGLMAVRCSTKDPGHAEPVDMHRRNHLIRKSVRGDYE